MKKQDPANSRPPESLSDLLAAEHKSPPAFRFELGGVDVYFGAGEVERLAELARELGMRRVLLVTDQGLVAAGHAARVQKLLALGDFAVTLFAEVQENPNTRLVEAGAAVAREARVDGLIALGGGSALDTCRGINFLVSNGGRMEDYWGSGHAKEPMLPSLGLPTTAGTGSEAQRFALISKEESHVKMACGDRKARFRTVILDPELLAGAPRAVAALAGIDAISHAVESFVSDAASPFSRLLAKEAWQRLERSFLAHLEDPQDPQAAADMQLGAHYAGAAIEASMLGAAHACANPLTARYGTRHGEAVALFLPHVLRFNMPVVAPLYHELASLIGEAGTEGLARRIVALRREAALPATLREIGVPEEDLPALTEAALNQWTLRYNPRAATWTDVLGLYRQAYSEPS